MGETSNLFIISHGIIENIRGKKTTTRFMDHLATTRNTRTSRRSAVIPLSEPDKPCCTRQSRSPRAKAHGTNAAEQQPSPMKRDIDRKDQTCKHMNEDWIQTALKTITDQILRDPTETHLHTPSSDARCTMVTGIEGGRHHSYHGG